IEALARHAPAPSPAPGTRVRADDTLVDARSLLPGMGEPVAVEVPFGSRAIGRTLKQLDLRSMTGASVLAIRRGDRVLVPTGHILAMMGTHEAIGAAPALIELLKPDTE